jgi:hypothetical protein
MAIIHLFQLVIFTALLFHTVQLLPAFGQFLGTAQSAFQSGYRCAILTVRLARNILGLILVTASTAPNPNIHALVPKGIALLVVLAVVNGVLTHFQDRTRAEGVRF